MWKLLILINNILKQKDIFLLTNKMILFLIFRLDGSAISSVLVSEYRCQCRINFCTTSFLKDKIGSEMFYCVQVLYTTNQETSVFRDI